MTQAIQSLSWNIEKYIYVTKMMDWLTDIDALELPELCISDSYIRFFTVSNNQIKHWSIPGFKRQ